MPFNLRTILLHSHLQKPLQQAGFQLEEFFLLVQGILVDIVAILLQAISWAPQLTTDDEQTPFYTLHLTMCS